MNVIDGLMLFFGFELAALLILLFAGIFARRQLSFVLAGVFSVMLMLLQCIILIWAAGAASATSGQQSGYSVLRWCVAVFVVALSIYGVRAFKRIE